MRTGSLGLRPPGVWKHARSGPPLRPQCTALIGPHKAWAAPNSVGVKPFRCAERYRNRRHTRHARRHDNASWEGNMFGLGMVELLVVLVLIIALVAVVMSMMRRRV